MHARYAALAALLVAVATAATAAASSEEARFVNLSPWDWFPSRRSTKSMLDYFFPSSRNAKLSPIYKDNANTTASPSTTTQVKSSTVTQTKSTGTSTTKARVTTTVTTTPKPKNTLKTSSQTASSQKHYTIYPSSILTKLDTTVQKTQSFSPSSSSSRHTSAAVPNYVDSTTAKTTLSEMVQAALNDKSTSKRTTGASKSTHADDLELTTAQVPELNSTDDLDSREGSYPLRDRPQKINDDSKKETVPLPAGSASVLAKPTKYHYYPHNQHIYLLPECAIQQVCNAVYVRLNYTQPLCACPSRYRDPCSASLNADDLHTTRLTTDSKKKYAHKAVTLVKTCEATSEMRECRAPKDWSLLALQNIRTGKSHYLVICRCPENHVLEGPMSHDQPTYASVPGIRVFGMMCVRPTSTSYQPSAYTKFTSSVQPTTSSYKVDYSQPHYNPDLPTYSRFPSHSFTASNSFYNRMARSRQLTAGPYNNTPPFPWQQVREFALSADWDN